MNDFSLGNDAKPCGHEIIRPSQVVLSYSYHAQGTMYSTAPQ